VPRALGRDLEVLYVFLLGTNTKEMMNVSRIFGMIVVVAPCLIAWGF
jgi:hypothetical protein